MIAPGPASSGIASGKTEMSSGPPTVLSSSAERERRSVRRSNTISSAISSSITPPAVRNAGRPMPSSASTGSPDQREAEQDHGRDQRPLERHAPPLRPPRTPGVSASRTGTSPSGSMTTNSVVKRRQDDVEHGALGLPPAPD